MDIPQPHGLDAPRWPSHAIYRDGEWAAKVARMLRDTADDLDSGRLMVDAIGFEFSSVGGIGRSGHREYIESGRRKFELFTTKPERRQKAAAFLDGLVNVEPEHLPVKFTVRDAIAADVDRLMTLLGAE